MRGNSIDSHARGVGTTADALPQRVSTARLAIEPVPVGRVRVLVSTPPEARRRRTFVPPPRTHADRGPVEL